MCWSFSRLVMITLSLLTGAAWGQDKYHVEVPTHRLALVVGNSAYTSVDELPSATQEADNIASVLKRLDFKISAGRDVNFDQFKKLLNEFVTTIQPDDFVVFYFSGHGFNYGNENYLVPLGFPSHVVDVEVPVNFIPVTSLQKVLRQKQPGYLLLILDACRSAAQFDQFKKGFDDSLSGPSNPGTQAPSPKDDVKAGLIDFQRSPGDDQSARVNAHYLYATSPGHTVDSGNQPGPFVIALAEKLPLPDRQFIVIEAEIVNYVKIKTKYAQLPWLSGSSSAEIYFLPNQTREMGELDLWDDALAKNDVDTVSAFRWRYSVSRFVHAARQWLQDHGEFVLASLTRVSPLAPELAWSNAIETNVGKPSTVTLSRFEGQLAFSRDYLNTDIKARAISAADIVAAHQTKRSAKATAEIFAKHGEAVLTGPITAVDSPSRGANPVAELRAGTKLTIVGSESREENTAWLEVTGQGLTGTAYLPLSRDTAIGSTNIGKPLKEISVGTVPGGIEGLANTTPATDGLRELRSAGRSVEWISISTPKAEDQGTRELFTLRVAHLISALDRQGVPRQRISVAGEDPTLPQDQLRMRIFGN